MERPDRDNLDPLALQDYIDYLEQQLEKEREDNYIMFRMLNNIKYWDTCPDDYKAVIDCLTKPK